MEFGRWSRFGDNGLEAQKFSFGCLDNFKVLESPNIEVWMVERLFWMAWNWICHCICRDLIWQRQDSQYLRVDIVCGQRKWFKTFQSFHLETSSKYTHFKTVYKENDSLNSWKKIKYTRSNKTLCKIYSDSFLCEKSNFNFN